MSYSSDGNLTISANDGNNAISLLYGALNFNGTGCFKGRIEGLTFDNTSSSNSNYYYLPYNSNNRLLIQFGQFGDQAVSSITFRIAFSNIPYMIAQQYNNGNNGGNAPPRFSAISTAAFTLDPQYGNSDKGPCMWFAIGLGPPSDYILF